MNAGTLAKGHSTRLPYGRRLVIPGDAPTADLASATGFVSTAADLARFFSQLAPSSPATLLSAAARRDMTRRHWRDSESTLERYYGLGTISGSVAGWTGSAIPALRRDALAHGGLPRRGGHHLGADQCHRRPRPALGRRLAHILKTFRTRGAPTEEVADWAGRWWNLWGAVDLVPVGNTVLACPPALNPPLSEVSEITVTASMPASSPARRASTSRGKPRPASAMPRAKCRRSGSEACASPANSPSRRRSRPASALETGKPLRHRRTDRRRGSGRSRSPAPAPRQWAVAAGEGESQWGSASSRAFQVATAG